MATERVSLGPERFDKKFSKDILIGGGIFAATTFFFVNDIPVIGSPAAMLIGPAVGSILCLNHRPPR